MLLLCIQEPSAASNMPAHINTHLPGPDFGAEAAAVEARLLQPRRRCGAKALGPRQRRAVGARRPRDGARRCVGGGGGAYL